MLRGAANDQRGLHVASSGSIALAAWNDARSRATGVIAARVDVTGKPLDPTGIVIRDNATLDDVFWDGADFVVITSSTSDHELVFVGTDGVIRRRVSLAVTQPYAAHTYEGTNSRILFLPRDGYSPLATVADLDGNIIKRGADDLGGTAAWPASNGTRFLVIRHGTGFAAEVIDRDGGVLSSIDPHLPADFAPAALSGDGRGGYVIIGYLPAVGDRVLIHLNADGLQQGVPVPLQGLGISSNAPRTLATMRSDGFDVTWTLTVSNTFSSTWVSRDGAPPVQTLSFTGGLAFDSAYDPDADLVFTSMSEPLIRPLSDVWVQKGTASPQPLTGSAADQSEFRVAAGANGFLAAWSEVIPGGDRRQFVRRFSADGKPLGDPAMIADKPLDSSPLVASSGDVYLVTGGSWARRMNARTGEWLDANPFFLRPIAMASNGKDALVLTLETIGNLATMEARRVAMTGEPLLFNPVPIPVSVFSTPLLASNGKDYLVVWADRQCGGCPVSYYRILAMRLGADGSLIDPAPIALTGFNGSVSNPSVSWNGTTYLVTWHDHGLAGAFISSDGNVQQLGSLGEGSYAAAAGSEFLIFRQLISGSGDEWDGRVLGESDWTPIVTHPNLNFFAPAVASNGAYVMLAYERISEEAGHVSRVFVDPRVLATRKRAVH